MMRRILLLFFLGPFLMSGHLFGQTRKDNTLIPVGLDAYRMWDRMPLQRLGVRAYMRSTYDREGGNQSADASHFLFANEENHNVFRVNKNCSRIFHFPRKAPGVN